MKSILFFSRCELVDLFGSINKHLIGRFEVLHLAYSKKEAIILKEKYNIKNIFIFKDIIEAEIIKSNLDHLIIKEIDDFLLKSSDNRFNINSAIQCDRGFSILNYKEALLLSQVYYLFWKGFILNYRIEFIFHEPTSLFFNHIAALLCKSYGGNYVNMIMTNSNKSFSYIFTLNDDANAVELNNYYKSLTEKEILNEQFEINSYLKKFRGEENFFLNNIIKTEIPYFKIISSSIKKSLINLFKIKKPNRIFDNIDYWLIKKNTSFERLNNIIAYGIKLKYDEFDSSDNYYYYPFHIEPEAVVLYWADGLYKGQTKLIENIAAQLPPNSFLYIKDHPHFIGYRNIRDYILLKNIPNIKLISPKTSGKFLVKNCKAVITINGTAGFEGVIYNKPVYVFGNSFYNISKRVTFIKNIRDFHSYLYRDIDLIYNDDQELHRFILAFIKSSHEGVIDFYGRRINKYPIDFNENSKRIARSIINLIQK